MEYPTYQDVADGKNKEQIRVLRKARRRLVKVRDDMQEWNTSPTAQGEIMAAYGKLRELLDRDLAYALLRLELGAEW